MLDHTIVERGERRISVFYSDPDLTACSSIFVSKSTTLEEMMGLSFDGMYLAQLRSPKAVENLHSMPTQYYGTGKPNSFSNDTRYLRSLDTACLGNMLATRLYLPWLPSLLRCTICIHGSDA